MEEGKCAISPMGPETVCSGRRFKGKKETNLRKKTKPQRKAGKKKDSLKLLWSWPEVLTHKKEKAEAAV